MDGYTGGRICLTVSGCMSPPSPAGGSSSPRCAQDETSRRNGTTPPDFPGLLGESRDVFPGGGQQRCEAAGSAEVAAAAAGGLKPRGGRCKAQVVEREAPGHRGLRHAGSAPRSLAAEA